MLCIQVWSGRFIGSWKKDNSQEWSLWFARPHFTCLNNQEIPCLEEILTKYLNYILLIILFNNFLSYLSEVTILSEYKFIKKHNSRIFQRNSFKSQWFKRYFKLALFIQFSSVIQSCLTLCDPMNHSTPGLSVHHQLPKFTQTHVTGNPLQYSCLENPMDRGAW